MLQVCTKSDNFIIIVCDSQADGRTDAPSSTPNIVKRMWPKKIFGLKSLFWFGPSWSIQWQWQDLAVQEMITPFYIPNTSLDLIKTLKFLFSCNTSRHKGAYLGRSPKFGKPSMTINDQNRQQHNKPFWLHSLTNSFSHSIALLVVSHQINPKGNKKQKNLILSQKSNNNKQQKSNEKIKC